MSVVETELKLVLITKVCIHCGSDMKKSDIWSDHISEGFTYICKCGVKVVDLEDLPRLEYRNLDGKMIFVDRRV